MTYKDILDLPMQENDAGAATIGGYLSELLLTLLSEGEGFSGKRPFGNSGWEYDLYIPLIKAGIVIGELDEDGYVQHIDTKEADRLLEGAIQWAFEKKT